MGKNTKAGQGFSAKRIDSLEGLVEMFQQQLSESSSADKSANEYCECDFCAASREKGEGKSADGRTNIGILDFSRKPEDEYLLVRTPEGDQELSQQVVDIMTERCVQNAKWGEQNHTPAIWLAILTEEVGEVAQEVLRTKFAKKPDIFDYRKEMVQVAAVALAAIECFDRDIVKGKQIVSDKIKADEAQKQAEAENEAKAVVEVKSGSEVIALVTPDEADELKVLRDEIMSSIRASYVKHTGRKLRVKDDDAELQGSIAKLGETLVKFLMQGPNAASEPSSLGK